MPLALLLQSAFAPLTGAGAVLNTWDAMLRLESLVIDRARGAFLVGWFGPNLPRADGRLVVVIDNIDALGRRYRQARAQTHGSETGPSLLEPVASMAGMAVGMFLSPSGAFMYLWVNVRTSLGRIGSSLVTLVWGPLMTEIFTGVGGAAAVVLLPFALLAGLILGTAAAFGWEAGPAVIDLVRDLSRAVQALTRFINLLTGPREAVRNPLLRQVLNLFDRVAALFAQLIGAAALLVTRIGPLILPTARQAKALIALAEAALSLAKAIFQDAVDILMHLVRSDEGAEASPWEVVKRMMRFAETMADRLVEGAVASLTALMAAIEKGFTAMSDRTRTYITSVVDSAKGLIREMPLMRVLRAALEMARLVRTLFGSSTSATAATAGGAGAAAAPPAPPSTASKLLGGVAKLVLPPAPTAPTLPSLVLTLLTLGLPPPTPSLAGAQKSIDVLRAGGTAVTFGGIPLTAAMVQPFELSEDNRRLADQLMQPPASVFDGEQAALRAELDGRTPQEALDALRAEDLRFRNLLTAVVGGVLPQQMRDYMPRLQLAFDALDHYVYQHAPEPAAPDFPVRSLPDNGLLRPIVHKFTVRGAGDDEFPLREFANDVVTRLRALSYPAPVADAAAAP